MDPIWTHFVGKKAYFGAKKRVFLKTLFLKKTRFERKKRLKKRFSQKNLLQTIFFGPQRVWGPQNPKLAL